ncbi:MAG: radical SAM family heme chaperone HemW [Cellvibrionaceae bacterium]|nr:radical SAM family heme chaperone HemW [Cellvibrionaceae bacterium]
MCPPLPPLSLYVHIPWCVKKCPYCDFNSHTREHLPVEEYLEALLADLEQDASLAQGRTLGSIFFGGGTPSLFPARAFARVIDAADNIIGLEKNAEITIEANPGTTEGINFSECLRAGINRVSLGLQSFNDQHLSLLGRIHTGHQAENALHLARDAGFNNINVDIMHSLPQQSVSQALDDLQRAIDLAPEHISWYQLTIEPNTEFYSRPPSLPAEDDQIEIIHKGQYLLNDQAYQQYEVSAYAKNNQVAQHNINYWQFGDYLGIGAGAHGKITRANQTIVRRQKTRLPEHYLDSKRPFTCAKQAVEKTQLPMEFLMNGLRLKHGVDSALFSQRTGLQLEIIQPAWLRCQHKGLMQSDPNRLAASEWGYQFLNSLLAEFIN